MQLRDRLKKQKQDRFQRFNIVFSILLAGWAPSILTLVVSYTILTRTLESKILRDRQTFIQLIAHLVGDDLSRTGGIIEYYQTLPDVAKLLTGPNAQFATQLWLGSTFYSHPRIDGMFITAPDGTLIASLPSIPELVGKDFGSDGWREQAKAANGAFVSAVHPRFQDKRMATDIVGAVRMRDGTIVGYLGVSVLVERMGRRLSAIEFADESICQVLDQNGTALFGTNFRPNLSAEPGKTGTLMNDIKANKAGHFERHGNLYSFSPVEPTGWVAVVAQPKADRWHKTRCEIANCQREKHA